MESSYRLHIKLGNAEFDAEGPQAIVQEAYDKFLCAVERNSGAVVHIQQEDAASSPHPDDAAQGERLGPALLQRAYATDPKRGIVSLRALPPEGPNKAGEAGLMILYGSHALLQMTEVPVTRLKAGLRQSGIQVDRVDRIMAPYSRVLIKGGAGVGGKYALNNQGTAQAEELLRKIYL